MSRMAIADQVTRIIVEHLGVDEHNLAPEAVFRDDLGADSLDAFELLLAFEDAFNIEIPDTDAGTMRCVQDAIAYIESHVTVGREPASRVTQSKGPSPGAPVGERPSRP